MNLVMSALYVYVLLHDAHELQTTPTFRVTRESALIDYKM